MLFTCENRNGEVDDVDEWYKDELSVDGGGGCGIIKLLVSVVVFWIPVSIPVLFIIVGFLKHKTLLDGIDDDLFTDRLVNE